MLSRKKIQMSIRSSFAPISSLTPRQNRVNSWLIIVQDQLNCSPREHDERVLNLKMISVEGKFFIAMIVLGAMGRILLYGFFKIIPAGKHESGICGAPILKILTSLKSMVKTCGQMLFFDP